MADRLDLVPREDFERLEMQVNDLQKRLEELEGSPKKTTKTKK